MRKIRYPIGSRNRTLFWLDTWVGDLPLAIPFPDLYRCARDQHTHVSSYMSRAGNQEV